MCGINIVVGIADKQQAYKVIGAMNAAMAHRGPDNDGIFTEVNVALGHRRLSIIDLSAAGNQPMSGANERYQIVYNGEFYNYREVKAQLLQDANPYEFKFASDTEVILAAYHKWGVNCLEHINGMFAFAIWDSLKKEVFIARDRLGIKPLYYYENNGTHIFSSEIRSLLSSGLIPRKLNKSGLVDYLRYQTVHAPQTIIEGVKMVMPGSYLLINTESKTVIEAKKYWQLNADKATENAPKSYKQVCEEVYDLLFKSVQRRLIADVPFGAFLSGGIDSSAVVGLMSKASSQTVKTFSVSFDEREFSEAKYAQMVADKFKTDHHEIKLTAEYFMQELPSALRAMDHPSGDGPNTYIVSKVTKNSGITMALSGLGGDELFAGYDIFKRSLKLQNYKWLASIPAFAKRVPALLLQTFKAGIASDKIAELLALKEFNFESTYPLSRQVMLEEKIAQLVAMPQLPVNAVSEILNGLQLNRFDSELSKVSVAEISTYMQNVLLRDTDQMSMASALEVRVPFLDYHLVEYVLSLSDAYKYPSTPKKLLIDALGPLLPAEIVNRPKMGFTLPWKHWMKNEMKQFCEERMQSLSARNSFHKTEILNLWNAFLADDVRITWSRIWYLVVLEDWLIQNNIED
ncbi:MAG: asparagine synthase (glutamine-hydrolyzing) [Bacteroidetes bacterium]|nr:asparagine synthase (glutamine-hydrolyzing) [Bacteroidota bacterium]